VGVVLNANYLQMLDLLLGWAGLDITGDDGRKFGRWPWQSEEDAERAATSPGWFRPRFESE